MGKTLINITVATGLIGLAVSTPVMAQDAVLFDGKSVAAVIHERDTTLGLAGDLLARDLKAVTGQAPNRSSDLKDCVRVCVVVARYDSPLVTTLARDAGLDPARLKGQWERYERVLVRSKTNPQTSYLLIAGSDTRGTVWGVIDLTREMGVSAWEWWADVTPRKVARLVVDGGNRTSETPSVQYRGIFLNDEDWGLQPWAAKTFEPEVKDIGPKTYARIFELMWRLKANTLWPAMHDSTKPFYQIKGNAEMARDYAIVMSTSHAEPMMRNNVREWDEKARGEFNFFTNREAMVKYWGERAEEVKAFENIWTIGLRGKHDSAMEGAKTPEQARDAMTEVFKIQRGLLAKAQNKPEDQVPQVLTLYKEVLDVYMTGLKVPEDVTLVWPEDNYGYINQLSTPEERKRKGGAGVYYHLSYWGRPHDYLWLATTHPALIREQMDRAYRMDARKIWIVNVGDIKPGEYLTQYFLDLAFDRKAFDQTPSEHLKVWTAQQFGADQASEIAAILTEYYDLAWARRPEFMGGGQTEPTRPNVISAYVRTGGDEAQARLDRYAELTRRAEAVGAALPADRRDAFFELVLYPVRASASLNERILKLDLAAVYAKAGRANVNALSDQAKAAHARIVADTAAYNGLGNGKWNGMMDMAPRRLPVFDAPIWPQWNLPSKAGCSVDASALTFTAGVPSVRYLSVYTGGQPGTWSLSGTSGLTSDAVSGDLNTANGFQQRVRLSYEGGETLAAGSVACGGKTIKVAARLLKGDAPAEVNRLITLPAVGFTHPLWQSSEPLEWEVVPGLGTQGAALRARLDLPSAREEPSARPITYSFATTAKADAVLRVIGLPVHPLTSANGLRLGVRIDGGPLQVLDFETFGRSEEWKQNVLSNSAVRTVTLSQLPAGQHRIEVYAMDPGFLLDRLEVRLDGAPDYYGASPAQ
ncbi:glycosyl hydrolase 115 family protein [Asticcacaulis sp. BYS171W]|uniref:Glycosyl hydrolase 115 family protein n=1 Tax=Asticcacaulis aquaticus TaxID=2984212 RepID=A0ABT5HWS8_9CAUL|nr:glycosyl hydrolase 115 family protein [Asticcacaulis aquaticus]MDC7684542.1 glycosyl hydrolase 115 family protein [Asticcacaulis aquaticus]